MKQALNILIAYLTCTDPVIQNKWLNLLHSFWHKDSGWLLKSITTVSGGYRFTVVDGDGNETSHDINIPTLPNSQPISFIQDLQSTLDAKVDKVPGKGLSTQDFTTALKIKLESLENYVHPEFHQISDIEGLQSFLDNLPNTYESISNKGAANGYTPLDSTGKIPQTYLPAVTITETFVVGNETEMLASPAQTGDVAVRTDESKSYILQGTDPSVIGDWQELLSPTSGVNSVNGLNGAVTLDLSFSNGSLSLTGGNTVDLDTRYSQLGHTHVWGDITGKPTTLAGYGITDAYPLVGNPSGFLTSFDITTQTDPKYLRSDESDTMDGSLTVKGTMLLQSPSYIKSEVDQVDSALIRMDVTSDTPYGNITVIGNGEYSGLGSLRILIEGTEKYRFHNSGNFSIGNVNDIYKLDVSGTGRFTGNLTAPNIITNETDTYASTSKVEKMIPLSQAEYDAIGTKNASTLYVII